jgi:hypothetical protein
MWYKMELILVSKIRPSELTNDDAVLALADQISNEGIWRSVLPVEDMTYLVMDGNHRLKVASILGISYLPCVRLSYSDPRVSVSDWNSGRPLSMASLTAMFQDHDILPFKSTRHRFDPALPIVAFPLLELR